MSRRRRRASIDEPRTVKEGLKDPNYADDEALWPRLGVNWERPYKHPDPVIEVLARRLYKTWCKGHQNPSYLPWRMLDPPTDIFRSHSHIGNGNIRFLWYSIAEVARDELFCEQCIKELSG